MPSNRPQVQDLYKDRGYMPQIQPQAAPVDTFVAPAKITDPNAKVLELIDAFSSVNPKLQQFAHERIQQSQIIDVEAGHKAALENKAKFKEAVDQGLIPAGASPWFQLGWERQKAQVSAEDYSRELHEAYAQTDLPSRSDPEALNTWVTKFTSDWNEAHPENRDNPEFASIFGHVAQQARTNLSGLHAAARTQLIEAEVSQNTERQLSAVLENHTADLLGNEAATTAGSLAAIVNAQVANGLNGQQANRLVAKAVVHEAMKSHDLSLLDLLDQVPSGSGYVGQIGYVKDMVTEARNQISYQKNHMDVLGAREYAAKRKASIDSVQASALSKIYADPFGADIREEFAEMLTLDPDKATQLETARASVIASRASQVRIIEDPQVRTGILLSAYRGEFSHDDIQPALAAGQIDGDTAQKLALEVIPNAKKHRSVINDPLFKMALDGMTSEITKNSLAYEGADVLRSKANQAEFALTEAMIKFNIANPEASELERLKYLQEFSGILKSAYGREPELVTIDGKERVESPTNVTDLRKIDPRKTSLFADWNSMKAAMIEHNQRPEGSRLKALADLYGMTVEGLFEAQVKVAPVDWEDVRSRQRRERFYFGDTASLDAAVREYEQSNGASGVLKDLSAQMGLPVHEFAKRQRALIERQAAAEAVEANRELQKQFDKGAGGWAVMAPVFARPSNESGPVPAEAPKSDQPLGPDVSPEDMNSWLQVLRNPSSPTYGPSLRKLELWDRGIGTDGKPNPALMVRANKIRLRMMAK